MNKITPNILDRAEHTKQRLLDAVNRLPDITDDFRHQITQEMMQKLSDIVYQADIELEYNIRNKRFFILMMIIMKNLILVCGKTVNKK